MKDENTLRKSLESIYPDLDEKVYYLNLFADAIEEANSWENENRKGFSNWVVVTPKKDKIRLIAGHHIVTTLNPDFIWMAFDEQHFKENPVLDNKLRNQIEWGKQNTPDGAYKLIGSINGYVKYNSMDETKTRLIMTAHRISVEKAIKKDVLRQGSIGSHNSVFVDVLGRITGRENLPYPVLESNT